MTVRWLFVLSMVGVLSATATLAAPAGSLPAAVHRAPTAARRAASAPSNAAHATPPHAAASARRLDDIHIEGEIPVPQVLFITARDQRRFMEFQHRRYLKTGRQLGEASLLPDRIVITPSRPTPEKETPR